MTGTPGPDIAAVYARAARASRSGSRELPDAPFGDPDPAETVEPTPPAPRPGPHLVPDVLGAVLENAAAGGRSRPSRARSAGPG